MAGDQMFFHIGRHHAKRLLARFPKLRDRVNVALPIAVPGLQPDIRGGLVMHDFAAGLRRGPGHLERPAPCTANT